MNTKDVGDKTVAMVLAALVRKGKTLLLPFGDNRRYDLAVDEGGRLVRVQCKTARFHNSKDVLDVLTHLRFNPAYLSW